jgi:hypothetical protein
VEGTPVKRPTNVHKFKIAAAIVGVLVVGAIGYTAWFVNHSEHVANDAYSQSNKSYTVKPAKKVATTQTQQYLTIKEWGVKLPYSGSDTFTYQLKPGTDSDGVQIISQNLSETYGCKNYGAGSLARYMSGDAVVDPSGDTAAQLYAAHSGTIVKLDNYYYLFVHDQAQCNDAAVKLQSTANDTIKSGLQKIQPGTQYLTIKEWGVKVPLSSEISDAKYLVKSASSNFAAVSVASLDKTYCRVDDVTTGSYVRFTAKDVNGIDGGSLLKQFPTAVKIGPYYYAYEPAQDGCTEQIGADRVTLIRNAFETAIKSVVAE